MKKTLLSSLVAAVLLSGCTANQVVPIADVKAQISPNKAVIELHRPHGYAGAIRGVNVYDNGKLIGDLANDSRLIWERDSNTFMCLNRDQDSALLYLVNPLIVMLSGQEGKPECFKVESGKVNQFKYDYLKGMFFTQQGYEQAQLKDKAEMEVEAERERKESKQF